MSSASRSVLAAASVLVLLLLPMTAQACPVCFAGNGEENRTAFLYTTIFLTSLPLAMIGGVVWWLRRRLLQTERERPAQVDRLPGLRRT